MNRNELNELIGKTQPNICQIVVLKDGREVYANEWNGYKRDDCTHIMSATKSIVSLLTGIAAGRGLIKSIDDRVLLDKDVARSFRRPERPDGRVQLSDGMPAHIERDPVSGERDENCRFCE